MASENSWPDPSEYGRRFKEIDSQLERGFQSAEMRWRDPEVAGRVRYRLAKLTMAGEDIQRAIAMLAHPDTDDEQKSKALVELRNACQEIADSFEDVDSELVALLNRTSD